MKKVIFILLTITLISVPCPANLLVKMTSDNTTLSIGSTALVKVWAFVDDPAAVGNNGLVVWQMDFAVDNAGVVGASNFNIVAPVDIFDSGSSTNALTGEVSGYVLKDDDSTSTVGVGGFTEIFTFEVTGLAVGTVEYSIGNELLGDLADFTPFDISSGTAQFDTVNSDNVFTVVPEPATILLFSLGALALRKKH